MRKCGNGVVLSKKEFINSVNKCLRTIRLAQEMWKVAGEALEHIPTNQKEGDDIDRSVKLIALTDSIVNHQCEVLRSILEPKDLKQLADEIYAQCVKMGSIADRCPVAKEGFDINDNDCLKDLLTWTNRGLFNIALEGANVLQNELTWGIV